MDMDLLKIQKENKATQLPSLECVRSLCMEQVLNSSDCQEQLKLSGHILKNNISISRQKSGFVLELLLLSGFRPGPKQTGLYSHRRWLEA